ncbi:MAG TPA: glycosyltransferase [Bacteroidales bacterium]|nr:glycosyltransferase [Bacteroidales bacterium]
MSKIEIIALITFLVTFLSQLYFYCFLFIKVIKIKDLNPSRTKKSSQPVSVIIAARNESENLKKNLPLILEQDYLEYEVIIANDYSDDNTIEVVKNFQKEHRNLKLINNCEKQGKKSALTSAILSSKYEKLLFIDADCYPASNKWIELMSQNFSKEKQIVLGLGMYKKDRNISNYFIRYDTMIIALQYISAALTGNTYMGVGRNLAYTKELWKRNDGFNTHKNIISGDDDLFISQASTKNNTAICTHPESVTISDSAKSFYEYIKQKARHLNTTHKYNFAGLFHSGGELFFRILFFLSILIFINSDIFFALLSILIIRLILITIIIRLFSIKINNEIPIPYIIIFDIFAMVFYVFLLFYRLLIHNKKQW